MAQSLRLSIEQMPPQVIGRASRGSLGGIFSVKTVERPRPRQLPQNVPELCETSQKRRL